MTHILRRIQILEKKVGGTCMVPERSGSSLYHFRMAMRRSMID